MMAKFTTVSVFMTIDRLNATESEELKAFLERRDVSSNIEAPLKVWLKQSGKARLTPFVVGVNVE